MKVIMGIFIAVVMAQDSGKVDIEQLFLSASRWRVGEAVSEVDSAREKLVEIGKPALDYIFSEKIRTTSTLEYRAIRAVVKRLARDAHPYLKRCLKSDNDTVLVNCLNLIGDVKDTALSPEIVVFLDKQHPLRVRRAAIFALGKLKYKKAVPEIAKCLGDSSIRTRLTAISALSEIGDPSAMPILFDTYLFDEFYIVRRSAGAAMAKIDRKSALQLVNEKLRMNMPDNIKISLIQLVDILIDDSLKKSRTALMTRHFLIKAFNDDNPVVRGYAVKVIGKMADENVFVPLRILASTEENSFVISQLHDILDVNANGG